MKIINSENLVKRYGDKENGVQALDHVSLEVEKGERIVVTGTSGSGKSTLLNVLSGLEPPDSGEVYIMEKNIYQMSRSERAAFRRKHVGFVFQNFQLMPMLTVKDNIVLPCQLDGKEVPEEYLDILMNQLGLKEKQDSYPWQLSGGQQQRTAIGRAIVKNPDILLCDEPTGALDYQTSKEILKLIETVNQKYGNTIVMVTHNDAIKDMADRVVKLRDGMIRKNYKNEQKIPAASLEW